MILINVINYINVINKYAWLIRLITYYIIRDYILIKPIIIPCLSMFYINYVNCTN